MTSPTASTDVLLASTAPLSAPPEASLRERFAQVDTWVFDLDNTLYPAGSSIWPSIDARITLYLATLLGIDGLSARALQKHYYRRYGTTLRGLMDEYAVKVDEFLDFVHDIDRTSILSNPDLKRALALLPGRKLILTNGSREHALRTTESLGFHDAFEDIFDIVAAELVPKPEASVYESFFKKHRVDPTRAAMFEDLSRNLVIPHQRGMRTVLIVPEGSDHREPWEAEGVTEPYVDFVTDNLAGFLQGLANGSLSP